MQLERIRSSLVRTDPVGIVQRCSQTVRRRKYQVPGPLSLWHIDGSHKLIRYVCSVVHDLFVNILDVEDMLYC